MRRGRGVSISSADCDLLLRWEREGMSWLAAMEGIDRAFQRLSRTPASLRQCARFIDEGASTFSDELLDPSILADVFGSSQGTSAPSNSKVSAAGTVGDTQERGNDSQVRADQGAVERICARLLELERTQREHTSGSAAYRALHDEVRELQRERDELGPDTLALLNEAFAIQVMDRLPPQRREYVDALLARAPRYDQVATLIRWVSDEEGLPLPVPPDRV